MVWTRRYFEHRAASWKQHAKGPYSVSEGHRAYAFRQVAFWEKLASVTWRVFKMVNKGVERVYGA